MGASDRVAEARAFGEDGGENREIGGLSSETEEQNQVPAPLDSLPSFIPCDSGVSGNPSVC